MYLTVGILYTVYFLFQYYYPENHLHTYLGHLGISLNKSGILPFGRSITVWAFRLGITGE